jgi:hypothetical protein
MLVNDDNELVQLNVDFIHNLASGKVMLELISHVGELYVHCCSIDAMILPCRSKLPILCGVVYLPPQEKVRGC